MGRIPLHKRLPPKSVSFGTHYVNDREIDDPRGTLIAQMGDDWTEVAVRGVVIDPVTGEPTILVEDEHTLAILAIPADPASAGSIISAVEEIDDGAGDDLTVRFFRRHGVIVAGIAIERSDRGELDAVLHYIIGEQALQLPIRPAEGLVLSARTGAPVFVHYALINTPERRNASPRVADGHDLLILSRTRHSTR